MKVSLDETKYAGVSPRLRERFFSFVNTAEFREIHARSFTWRYLELGPRDGIPLLFFTGGVKFPVFSFAVIEAFSRSCRVIAPVQPNCRSLAKYFEGIDVILEGEKIDAFCVAGSSWGGQIAQVAALLYADRVQKAVLANTGISAGIAVSLFLRLYRWSVRRKDHRIVMEDFRARALKMLDDSGEAVLFWEAVFNDLYAQYMSYDDYVSLLDTQIDYVHKYMRAVRRCGFAKPVLILASKDETAGSTKMRKELLRAYPHAHFHEFEAGGHHPALLHPEEYRRVVENFLLRTAP